MSKLWFWSYIGRSVARSRVKEMLNQMEESPEVQRLILDRFCPPTKTQEQCDYYPVDRQKEDMPDIDRRARGWVDKHIGFFALPEIAGIAKCFCRRQSID